MEEAQGDIAIVAGIATFLSWYWYWSGWDLAFCIEWMVMVIVICCPHALGLAVPLVVARSTTLSARNGLLICNRTEFENARKITRLVQGMGEFVAMTGTG